MKKRFFVILACVLAASMMASMLIGCGTKNPEPETPVESEEEEVKELTEEDIKEVIMNLGDKYVVEGSEADHFFNITYDPSVITSFKAEGDIAADKIGTYVVIYTLTADEDALKEAPSFEEADLTKWVLARDDQDEKDTVKGTELKITNTIRVVSEEDGQNFAENGELVYTSNEEIIVIEPEEEETEEPEEEKKEESKEQKPDSTSGNSTKPSDTSGSGTKPSSGGSSDSGSKPSGNTPSTPSTPKPECSHNWVQQYRTVHHDAKTHTEQVQVGSEPVYDYRPYDVCNGCGIRNPSTDHGYQHAVNGENASTHTEWEEVQVGSNPIYETRTITDQAAYDEQVPNGYKCSKCGKTK